MAARGWCVYIVGCRDGTLYTGATKSLQRRIDDHNRGKGCRYTSGRRPVKLLYCESGRTHSSALRREARIKRLSRAAKMLLCRERQKYRRRS